MFTCGNEKPAATAKITGSEKYNTISGRVDFYDTYGGTIVTAKIQGIPEELGNRFWGFHIHVDISAHVLNMPYLCQK